MAATRRERAKSRQGARAVEHVSSSSGSRASVGAPRHRAAGTGLKPYRARIAWPASERTAARKALAASGCVDAFEDGDRVDNRLVAAGRRDGGDRHLLRPRQRIRRVDHARVDFPARHVVQHLADVLREDELRTHGVGDPRARENLLGVAAGGAGLRVDDRDPGDSRLRQVREGRRRPAVDADGTISTISLAAKSTRVPGSRAPSASRPSMSFAAAAAKTSAGAPPRIWASRSPEAPKLNAGRAPPADGGSRAPRSPRRRS